MNARQSSAATSELKSSNRSATLNQLKSNLTPGQIQQGSARPSYLSWTVEDSEVFQKVLHAFSLIRTVQSPVPIPFFVFSCIAGVQGSQVRHAHQLSVAVWLLPAKVPKWNRRQVDCLTLL
jgi:hypothetical protein